MADKDELEMLAHYKDEAQKHGEKPSSTMEDSVVREREIGMIRNFIKVLGKNGGIKVLDLGCGNGYALSLFSREMPKNSYFGTDYSTDLVKICNGRKLANVKFQQGDARKLPFKDGELDAAYTERCLINVLTWDGQKKALEEIHRVLKPGGHYLMIEAFTDGLAECNKARMECGLSELKPASHNIYFEKEKLWPAIEGKFDVVKPEQFAGEAGKAQFAQNFLSSHYFISRVLHALVTKGGQVKNTEFVKFFGYLPPIGNYSQIEAFILRKK